jgi:hypothetical protein
VAAFALLFAAAVARASDWTATVLAVGLVPVATELTCYYSVLLVAYALLFERQPPIGAALVGLSALSWVVVQHYRASGLAALTQALSMDEIFAWISFLTVVFVVFATARVWASGRALRSE